MFASVDIGGTITSCAVATGAGQMVGERTIPTLSHEGPEGVLRRIAAAINEMAAAAGQRLAALGVGVPGLADFHRGRTLFLPNLPTGWRDFPVADRLSAAVGCPVFLLNDARMAALGELWFGHGRGVKTMVAFTVGTGIGGGVVIDRKLRLGPLGAAGELGHQTILPDGPLCGCGNHGCLETLASGPALIGEGVRLMKSGHATRLHEMVEGDLKTWRVRSGGHRGAFRASRRCHQRGRGAQTYGRAQKGPHLGDAARPGRRRPLGRGEPRGRGIPIANTTGFETGMMGDLIRLAAEGGYVPDVWECPDLVGKGRPAPWMAHFAAKELDLYPLSAFVKVGDTVADIEEAHNAGMWAVSVVKHGNEVGLSREAAGQMPANELEN